MFCIAVLEGRHATASRFVSSWGSEEDEGAERDCVDAMAAAASSMATAAADPGGGVASGALAATEPAEAGADAGDADEDDEDADTDAGNADEDNEDAVAGDADSARIWAGGA